MIGHSHGWDTFLYMGYQPFTQRLLQSPTLIPFPRFSKAVLLLQGTSIRLRRSPAHVYQAFLDFPETFRMVYGTISSYRHTDATILLK